MRILLVDDDDGIIDLVQRLLIPYSSRFVSVKTLEECFALTEIEEFDVVLLDLTLEGSSPLNTADQIYKLRAQQPSAAIIVVSGYDDVKEMRRRCLENGADLYLPKQEMRGNFSQALYSAVGAAIMGRPRTPPHSETYEKNVMLLKSLSQHP